ncbi:MAG: helix-turn-helix domain-containing protein [Patescibacteria group bacterium]|mgnify:CR=1 FL=1
MYREIFQQLGLSKNEAAIYETLLTHGESSVDLISRKSKVYRRNVYDSLRRLMEKGLAFEILASREKRYQAVEPDKLMELLQEKEAMLANVMPELKQRYRSIPREHAVFIYRGPEGWKNYLSDMLRNTKEAHFIAAKGAWLDKRIQMAFPQFSSMAKKKGLTFYHLFDHEVKKDFPEILKHAGSNYKFLPKGYSTPAAIDVFGNRVYVLSDIRIGGFEEDFAITVIVNQQVADAFRTWFKLMWDLLPEERRAKAKT